MTTTTTAITQTTPTTPPVTTTGEGVCAVAVRDWVLHRGGSADRLLHASPSERQQLEREIGPCHCARCRCLSREPKGMLTPRDLAREFGLPVGTIRGWVRRGLVPSLRYGRGGRRIALWPSAIDELRRYG